MNFFLTHGLDMPGPYEQLGPREMDTRWPLPKGAVVIGVPVWPPTHQLLYKYRYRMLAGMISNQRSMVIDTADGGPTVWLFFFTDFGLRHC